jgi:ATP-dependent Clp protease ATP-binding subunit ClpB
VRRPDAAHGAHRAAELARILELQLRGLSRMLAQRGVTRTVTDGAKRAIVDQSYDPAFGARPLRRVFRQKLQDPLAQLLLERGSSALSVTADVNSGDAIELQSGR